MATTDEDSDAEFPSLELLIGDIEEEPPAPSVVEKEKPRSSSKSKKKRSKEQRDRPRVARAKKGIKSAAMRGLEEAGDDEFAVIAPARERKKMPLTRHQREKFLRRE